MDPSSAPVCDPKVVERVLDLLRRWGWEAAESRIRDDIHAAPDPDTRSEREILAAWMTAERGGHAQAEELFAAAGARPELKAWALAGTAFVAFRTRNYDHALRTLDLAA